MEEAEKERAIKKVFEATLRDQVIVLVVAKGRATEAERSCAVVERGRQTWRGSWVMLR